MSDRSIKTCDQFLINKSKYNSTIHVPLDRLQMKLLQQKHFSLGGIHTEISQIEQDAWQKTGLLTGRNHERDQEKTDL